MSSANEKPAGPEGYHTSNSTDVSTPTTREMPSEQGSTGPATNPFATNTPGDDTEHAEGQGADAEPNDDVRDITGFRWILICLGLYLSSLMYGLDTTIAADVQGAVIETFGDVPQLSWIGAGFPLGSVAVILPYGFLYTVFNMKWLYVAGILLFQAGSALCGAAPSMNALIVGRVSVSISSPQSKRAPELHTNTETTQAC